MGVLTTFIIGAVAGGATWELYKRRATLQLKDKALARLRRKQPSPAAGDTPLPEVEEVAIITETVELQLDRLEAIHGIGPVYARRLNEAGILTYANLAQTPAERLIAIVSPEGKLTPDVEAWIAEANQLLEQAH